MKLSIQAGKTSQSVNVFIRDSSSTTGAGLAAVAAAGGALLSGTKLYYSFTGANASAGVQINLSVLAAVNSAWSSAGIVTLDGTNMIGWVRIDIPDAALAASKGRLVSFLLFGGTNMAPTPFEIELTGWDNQDAVRGGMTALPNANAGATNGLPLSVDSSGRVDVLKINGTSQTARDIGASVLLSAGSGTGQLDFTSGVVKSNLAQILGTALTETAGQIAGAFKKFFNVAAPTLTCLGVDQTGDSYARVGAPAGASVSADIAAVKSDSAAIKAKTDNLPAAPAATGDIMKVSSGTGANQVSLSSGLVTVGTNNDKTGYLLSAAGVQAIWDALTSALTTANSIGKYLVGLLSAIWDEPTSSHQTAGSTGKALTSAGSAGDPWTTALPGSYAAGTAGKILGTNLDKQVSTISGGGGIIGSIGFPKDDPIFKKLNSYMDDSLDRLEMIMSKQNGFNSQIAESLDPVYKNLKRLTEKISSLEIKSDESTLKIIEDVREIDSTKLALFSDLKAELLRETENISIVLESISKETSLNKNESDIKEIKKMIDLCENILSKTAPTEILEQIKGESNETPDVGA